MRVLLAIPALIILIAFALSNQQPVQLGIWPTDILLSMPISVAILIAAGLFFILGGFMTWAGAVSARARARRAERAVKQLEAQLASIRSRPVAAGSNLPMLPPA